MRPTCSSRRWPRRAALHRLDHLPGIPRHLREGPGAGAPLPEDRHRRADRGETYEILQGLKSKFELHHGVTYSDEALQAAVDLSVKHIGDRLLPDKAIDVIDEAGARQRLLPEGQRKELIDVEEVEAIVAKIARIPPSRSVPPTRMCCSTWSAT
jgi:hypothetical protein